ncbi:aminoglycoside phosphotransferase family protein [Streptacidiphilus sp. MAP5-52]|uniref:aminoglycoside phosphotransferase family protein n=1 Tax=Streptacidiphilus sp. MAP5-52 TaxID=3156267 RepID=UPI0035118941
MIQLPASFVSATLDRDGATGTDWLANLPTTAELLMTRWGCLPDGEPGHGGVGIVIPVLRTGEPAVLKVSPRHPENAREPDALIAWNGHGAVRLLERDDEHGAMLLERAHRTTLRQNESDDEVAQAAGCLHRLLTVPAPPHLPLLQNHADAWEEQLHRDRRELPHDLPAQAVDAALATARDLGRAQPRILVHGDFHARNILSADREPWLAIDPKGVVGDPAYDTGTLVKARAWQIHDRGDLSGAVNRFLDAFTEAACLDRAQAKRWAQLHAVQAAFSGHRRGFRVARTGPQRDRVVDFAEHLAHLLTEPHL